ncbi:MAG: hypothetical protein ACLP05_05240 [Candidatus Kryptoniota bacterium]
MSEIIRDPAWQFVGVLLGLAAIIVSLLVVRWQRQRKSLSYDIPVSTQLLDVKEAVRSKLEILYEGKPVQDVHLLLVRIVNTGNLPILPNDYERPIRLEVGGKAQLLSCEVYDTSPKSLRVSPIIEGNNVNLPAIMLNGGDAIVLKLIVSNPSGGLQVDGRIVGVREITEFKEGQSAFRLIYYSGLAFFLIGFIGLAWLRFPPSVAFPLMVLGIAVMGIAANYRDNKRKKFMLASAERSKPGAADNGNNDIHT